MNVKFEDFDEHIQEVLMKMGEFVGIDIKKVDFGDTEWYTRHEWSEEKQQEFSDWLTDYLYKKNKARKVIAENPLKNKKHLRKVADWFIFNYGWKLKVGDKK